jgi:CRP/FNR family transcriptional regulator
MGSRNQAPYGLQVIPNCVTCPVRESSLFCNLSPEALAHLTSIRKSEVFPAGKVLFLEAEDARGVYVLCSGKAKLTATSANGRSVIVRLAEGGEVLGLSETISEGCYAATAELLAPSQINFLPRLELLRFLERHSEVAMRIAAHLSMELRGAYRQIARVVLSPSAQTRVASLLLDAAGVDGRDVPPGTQFRLGLTHEEMAEIIGTSRETVSRTLSDLRRDGLIHMRGAYVTLLDPRHLKELVA